ncbi:MAG: hypothetical protein EOP47_05515 [Sphingobacteriaceae bacterium]|nr:MAG: hypothetical protein EOP47_05515 [Sphingobacteriaceae bacterium]
MKEKPVGVYIILFFPWILAVLFYPFPVTSYFLAWLGSFYIFYITLTGKLKPLPTDRSISAQLMRPIFLAQIIFAGFMCITSIFYLFNTLGYEDFKKVNDYYLVDQEQLKYVAQCQRYYCLAHASFVSGILIFMRYPVIQRYKVDKGKIPNLLFIFAIITLPVSVAFKYLPGLGQFYYQLSSLSFIAGTLALAYAIPLQKLNNTLICTFLYLFNFYQALLSGFKEPIIISVLVLGVFLYPNYKRAVTFTFLPLLFALFMLLPTYNRVFRQNSWSGETTDDDASKLALKAVLDGSDDSNWEFFVYRLSEIEMFTLFIKSTPDKIGYYGLQLVKQSFMAIVPRALWPSKPITEDMIMERVYDANVIYRGSKVSAKPAFVVDAYLSGGTLGIFISLFLYGAIAQLISLKAEQLFGGYTLGTALIFTGLFQILWRGLSFEFLINTVFWSYVTMLIISKIFKLYKILEEA